MKILRALSETMAQTVTTATTDAMAEATETVVAPQVTVGMSSFNLTSKTDFFLG